MSRRTNRRNRPQSNLPSAGRVTRLNKRMAQSMLLVLGALMSCTLILSMLPLRPTLPDTSAQQQAVIPTPFIDDTTPTAANAYPIPTAGQASAAPTPSDPVVQARMRDLDAKLQQNPNDLQSLLELGTLAMNTGQWQGVITYDTKALAIDPTNTQVRADLGWAYFQEGNTKQAVSELRQAVDADGSLLEARLNLGIALYRSVPPDTAGALAQWQAVSQADPNGALGQRARAYINQVQ